MSECQDPDAELFALIAEQTALYDELDAARGNTNVFNRILRKKANRSVAVSELIALSQPKTLDGLIAKANHALRDWRREDGSERHKRIWACQASALEQALEVIATLEQPPVLPQHSAATIEA